jgi:MinD-like ATPase involved in chromosome partitioning or flagellar assembly
MPSIVNVVCYSYKGGSGRSTAAVNIAFALATAGKKVICLDMDIGAPGLHMIMKNWSQTCSSAVDKNDGRVGLQDFLNLSDPHESDLDLLNDCIFDVGQTEGTAIRRKEKHGGLLFVFSSTRQRTLTDLTGRRVDVERFIEKYRLLQQALAARVVGSAHDEVYVIVDAPNGITPVSLPLLRSADLILMFYRHSVQHVIGTIETAEKIRHYLAPEIERRFLRILLVGSCVPRDWIAALDRAHGEGAVWEDEAEQMYQKFSEIKTRLHDFGEADFAVRQVSGEINEDAILKVLEQPLTGEGIHRKLIDPDAAGGDERISAKTLEMIELIADELVHYGNDIRRRKVIQ